MSIFDDIAKLGKSAISTVFPPAKFAFDIIDKLAGKTGKTTEELEGLVPEIQAMVVQRDTARDQAIEESYQVETKAKAEVMVATLKQDDNYTKRARPTVVYGGLVLVLLNHVVLPWVAFFVGLENPNIQIPGIFWGSWGGICGTFAIGRTMEKRGKPDNIANKALSAIGL